MKYLHEFRSAAAAKKLSGDIKSRVTRPWRIMEVCGGQTHTILQYGIEDLLPPSIEILHGPGCPVCVTPIEIIDQAVAIAKISDVILCSFGDMLRVPGSNEDLLLAKTQGADVRSVYSPLDAVQLAQKNPKRQVVFFAVGFETTAPANALAVLHANQLNLENFFVLCAHVTVPPILKSMLASNEKLVDGFLGPGHVCAITGLEEYDAIAKEFSVPIVISGFEPLDILQGIAMCIDQLEQGQAFVENQYARAVHAAGNRVAANAVGEVFVNCTRNWRGLGQVQSGGLRLSEAFEKFDAARQFPVKSTLTSESPNCISGDILRGRKKPTDCPAYGKQCTPQSPLGATMVSSEGTCANYYKFGKFGSN